jgi:hypothetical protein
MVWPEGENRTSSRNVMVLKNRAKDGVYTNTWMMTIQNHQAIKLGLHRSDQSQPVISSSLLIYQFVAISYIHT